MLTNIMPPRDIRCKCHFETEVYTKRQALRHWTGLHDNNLPDHHHPRVGGPALMVMWSEALPLTVSCLSPLSGTESQPGHSRNLPVTLG